MQTGITHLLEARPLHLCIVAPQSTGFSVLLQLQGHVAEDPTAGRCSGCKGTDNRLRKAVVAKRVKQVNTLLQRREKYAAPVRLVTDCQDKRELACNCPLDVYGLADAVDRAAFCFNVAGELECTIQLLCRSFGHQGCIELLYMLIC